MKLLVIAIISWMHAFHLATGDLKIETETNRIYLTLTVFADDLESAVNRLGNKQLVDILNHEKKRENKIYIHDFLRSSIYLTAHQNHSYFHVLGYELDGNRCFLYLENSLPDGRFNLHCRLFTDIFPDQKNILHLLENKNRSSHLLDRDRTIIEIDGCLKGS